MATATKAAEHDGLTANSSGWDSPTNKVLWALLIVSGILVVNAILVITWLEWRRRKQKKVDPDDVPEQQPEDVAQDPGVPSKEVASPLATNPAVRDSTTRCLGAQSSFERLVLPIDISREPIGRDHDDAQATRAWPPDDSEARGGRQLEQEKVNAVLPPMLRRSSIESSRSEASSLEHPPRPRGAMDHGAVPPSPSEASWRDVEMCSMSPVSPLGEEDGLVSRIDLVKK